MLQVKRYYPFNVEQTVNIFGEAGPLVIMFVVNALLGVEAGTWALLISTAAAIVVMRIVLRRLPAFPLIASGVTVLFGSLTIITDDPTWIQIKVTLFNILFAAFLFSGLALNRNFFKYAFESTFHYRREGWNEFTWRFAWFFVFTAALNEMVRLSYEHSEFYNVLGLELSGINIWVLFKVAFVMPLTGLYAWYLTCLMRRYAVPRTALVPASTSPSRDSRIPATGDR